MSPCGVLSLINLSPVFLYILVLSCCLGSSLCTDQGYRADSTSSSTSSGNKSEASFILIVEPGRLICAEYGELLNISCSVRASNDKTVDSWSISWLSKGASLSNVRETITLTNNSVKNSGFSVRVNWSSNDKVFTCLAESSGTESRDGQQILNESVVVRLNPQPVNITGARFIETIRGQIMEVFWKPIERNSVVYTLKYCLDYTEDDLGPICPNYNILESQCQFRERRYYGVPATAGMTCNASLSYGNTAPLSVLHVLNVVSNRSECQSQGSTRNFELAIFAEPNIDLLVMIPHPVEDVQILVTRQRIVRLSWSYPSLLGVREYSVEYNCSNNNITSLGISSKTHINLGSKALHSYRPYALCRFCVKARFQIPYHGGSGAFSEPVCRETRLHEEIPSDAPKITCRGEGCETTSDDVARNVTVTWTLPPRESWNGVLENVTVVYRRSNNRSEDMEVSETNITKGATVLRGLGKNSSYIIAMTACNKEGCSRQGNGMAISAQPPEPALSLAKASAGKDRRLPAWALGVVVLALLVGLGLIIIAAIVIKMKRRDERDTREPLPDLQAPEDYDNPDARRNEYANLEDKRQGQENVA